jgi:DNA-binding response OmpR family regulator
MTETELMALWKQHGGSQIGPHGKYVMMPMHDNFFQFCRSVVAAARHEVTRPVLISELPLTPLPRRVLAAVVAKSPEIATRADLMAILPTPSQENLDRQILLTRRALRPHGIAVHTRYGVGYSIDKAGVDRLSKGAPAP